jgi:hypothetical protein
MHRRSAIILMVSALIATSALAQDIYVYPNRKLSDRGLLEYRRYTSEEAQAYEEGGSFAPYTTLSWGPERRLTEQENVYRARVVASGDSLFCAYPKIWGRQVFFIRSLNAGIDWEPFQTLVDTSRSFSYNFPEICINGSNLLIGMGVQENPPGNNLAYFISSNYGETWGDLSLIFPYETDDILHFGSFCSHANTIYSSYVDVGSKDSIYVLRSANWGGTWNGFGVNVAYLSSTPQPMTVRAWGNNVCLVWVNENQPISCRYSRSTDMGQTWTDEIDISEDSLGAQRVFVAVQDSHVVVCWKGYKYSPYAFTGDLFIKQSFDGGETWGEEQVLTELHKVWMGSVYVKDSLIVATWQDTRFEGGNNEVMAILSFDYGQSWTDEERLSYADYDSHAPVSCVTGDRIHVFWGDMRLNAPGLYYCVNDPSTDVNEVEISHPTNIYICSYPNPFNAQTLVTYNNIEGGDIGIYDITGRLIKTLTVNGKDGNVMWDATDNSGRGVASGIYFARVECDHYSSTVKLLYLR